MALPVSIEGLRRQDIVITWEDGHATRYLARDVRLACRCAHCVHEWTGVALLDPASVPPDVEALQMELVGSYGLRIDWSDGHTTGIYRFEQLRADCPCAPCAARRKRDSPPAVC